MPTATMHACACAKKRVQQPSWPFRASHMEDEGMESLAMEYDVVGDDSH